VACLTEFQCAVYADGEAPAREAREISEHVETCPACRRLVSGLRTESRVLVDSFQSTDFIEFELEDETLSAPQAHSLSVARFAAFVLAMSVLLRPVLSFVGELQLPQAVYWLVVTAVYVVPAGISVVNSVLNSAVWIAASAILLLAFLMFSRRSMVTSAILSVLALLTVFSTSGYGLDVRRGDKPVTVPSGETVDDTLVVAGDSVTVEGTVTGDLVAFVRQVTIRGTVKGNVISFAQRIDIQGTVEGSVVGFAQSVETRGQVAHNIYAFGQRVDIGRDARVEENVTVIAREADIEGTIGKDTFAGAGTINVLSPARIGGALNARVSRSEDVRVEPGATIAGQTDIRTSAAGRSRYATLSFYVWQIIWLAGAFLSGLVAFRMIPALARANFETSRELLLAAGAGFVALIATPVAAVLASITLIGLPIGLMLGAAWVMAAYLAKIVIAGFIGRSLLQNTGETEPSIAPVLLAGLIPVFIATNLPYIGGLINLLLVILGLGAIAIQIVQMPWWRPAQAA